MHVCITLSTLVQKIFSLECPSGTFGIDCKEKCTCKNGGLCDKATGRCNCGLGWTGDFCESGKANV